MQQSTVSPLAQKLAESHNVDLAAVKAISLEGTITARTVLDFLSLTYDEEAAVRRRAERKMGSNEVLAAEENSQTPEGDKAEIENTSSNTSHFKSVMVLKEPSLHTDSEDDTAERYLEDDARGPLKKAAAQALSQTRAQLQATALVHQKALMQVEALRHENEALDHEVEQLRSKEAATREFIYELEQKKLELERELEKSRKRSTRFAWLRKHVF